MPKGRTKGAYEYKEDAIKYILNCVGQKPQTTHAITQLVKRSYFNKIHSKTVERLLQSLQDKGEIKGYAVGRIKVWQK